MNDTAILMKNEIRSISKYRALLLSKYYLNIILGFTSLYLGAKQTAISSLYILIFLDFLPPILVFALKDYSSKYKNNKFLQDITQEDAFQLKHLKKKYKYTKIGYIANAAAYIFTMILICLWQLNYYYVGNLNDFLRKLPLLTLATSVTLRFLAVIIYRIKLPYNIMHNKT